MTGGEVSEDTRSILNIGAAAGIGYLGYRGVKSGMSAYRGIGAARTKMAEQAGGRSYYDPKEGRMRSDVAGKKGRFADTKGATGFLKSPRWQKFLDWLTKKGKRKLVTKITQRIAIATTTAAVTATGVGAAFGAIGFLLNLGFSLFLMYEIYQLWQEWTSVEEAEKAGVGDAAIAKEINDPDATRVSGAPVASIAQQQSLTPIPADIEKILAALRTNESGGNYGENSAKKGSTASGAYQFLDSTWKERAAKAGIGTEYPRAYMAPPEIQDAVAAKWVQDILAMPKVNGDVSKVPLVWFTGNPEGDIDAYAQSVNAVTPAQVQAKFMKTYDGGKYADSSYSPSGGDSSALGSVASARIDTVAKLFGTLGSAVIKPGVKRTDLMGSAPNTPAAINNQSMKIETDIALGINKTKTEQAVTTPATPGVSPSVPQPMKSISNMDPNYRSLDMLSTYLGHFKMAAA
jgi:hypothetical protein